MRKALLVILLLFALYQTCAAASKEAELEKVAKDWCAVIRASQVMPVYPMTEDLFPGDVFLVQQTIDQQQKIWRKSGYLPLDYHITRIDCKGYRNFYDHSFVIGEGKLPGCWLCAPGDGGTASAAWRNAPTAAFPSYSFKVTKNSGFSAAFPIQAIPIGLTLLGASDAWGSVTLSDARTYGVDIYSLYKELKDCIWKDPDLRRMLARYAGTKDRPNYLRVVNRVYLVGKVDVSVSTERASAWGAKAAVPTPLELIMASSQQVLDAAKEKPASDQKPASPAPAEGSEPAGGTPAEGTAPAAEAEPAADPVTQYQRNIDTLNTVLSGLSTGDDNKSAGASFKAVAASGRSVSLAGTFDRPQIIGYLGFDCEISPDGLPGPPVPTWCVVTGQNPPSIPADVGTSLLLNQRIVTDYGILRKCTKPNKKVEQLIKELDEVSEDVPKVFPCTIYGGYETGDRTRLVAIYKLGQVVREKIVSPDEPFSIVTVYYPALKTSVDLLRGVVAAGSTNEEYKRELGLNLAALGCLEDSLAQHRDLFQEVSRCTAEIPYP